MPTFFVIGAAKCGTTSLHGYLDQHPEISMSRVKEPRFFCRRLPDYHLERVTDRDEYLALFESGTAHRGEASPQYTSRGNSSVIASDIAAEVPDARLVYLVRDPVERVPSQYAQNFASRGRASREFFAGRTRLDAASLVEDIGDLTDPANQFTSQGLYMSQINAYLEFFPPEALLVVDSDDLRNQRERTLGEIFRFLGLEPVFDPVLMAEEKNRGSDQLRDSDTYLALAGSRPLRAAVDLLPDSLREPLVSRLRRTFGAPLSKPALDPGLRERLEALYRPEVEALREFTGKSFSGWSI